MKKMRILVVALSLTWMLTGLSGCARQGPGPMEKAGKKIDQTGAKIKEAAKETKESVKKIFKKENDTKN
jgi:predicted small secreted protein